MNLNTNSLTLSFLYWAYYNLCNFVAADHQLLPSTPTDEIRGYYKRDHSFSIGSGLNNWDITGDTFAAAGSSVRLTSNLPSTHGGFWNIVPVSARDWEIIVTVKIHGSTGDMYGDGMAIWYVKDRDTHGNWSEVFGYKNQFHGLGVFIDTYSNHNGPHNHAHPYISATVSNGDLVYDHDTDGTHTQLGNKGCTAKLRNKEHDTNIMVRYVDDTISVYMDINNDHTWRECFSVGEVRLPTGYYFGLSAATGDLSDNHEVISFKMYEIDVPRTEKESDISWSQIKPEAKHFAAPRDHVQDPKPSRLSGFGTTLLVILALIAVAAVLVVGVIVLQKRQENSRKRFY